MAATGEKSNSGLIAVISGCIFLWLLLGRFKKRCRKCKKWGAMKEIERKFLETKENTSTKTVEVKDENGQVVRTEEISVPVMICTYEVFEKCKQCGHQASHVEEEKKGV